MVHRWADHRRAVRMRRLLYIERVELLGNCALQFGVPLVDFRIEPRNGHIPAGRETRLRISNAECVIRRKPLVNGRDAEVKTKFATVSNGWSLRRGNSQESTMRDLFRKTAIAATAAIAIATTTIAASTPAEAHWRGGGWGWGVAGFAIGTGLAWRPRRLTTAATAIPTTTAIVRMRMDMGILTATDVLTTAMEATIRPIARLTMDMDIAVTIQPIGGPTTVMADRMSGPATTATGKYRQFEEASGRRFDCFEGGQGARRFDLRHEASSAAA